MFPRESFVHGKNDSYRGTHRSISPFTRNYVRWYSETILDSYEIGMCIAFDKSEITLFIFSRKGKQ